MGVNGGATFPEPQRLRLPLYGVGPKAQRPAHLWSQHRNVPSRMALIQITMPRFPPQQTVQQSADTPKTLRTQVVRSDI